MSEKEIARSPRGAHRLAQAAAFTIPLIAWSRDIAVVTLILACLSVLLRQPGALKAAMSPPGIAAGLFLAWSGAALYWAPHLPWVTWLKSAAIVGLGGVVAVALARRQSNAPAAVATAALGLCALLVVERVSGGFFIGLHRESATTFQRLTILSGGLVLLCTTCFACAAVLSRYLGALIAVPLWTGVVLAVSLSFPMDAEVAAILAGAAVFVLVLLGGRLAAIALMSTMLAIMLAWGFLAEGAAEAGLHRWLIANVDPNWGYRIEIWRYVHDLVRDRIIEGYGFDASRVLGQSAALMPSFEGKTSFLHPHNGLLQIWLELGLVGVLLLAAALALGFREFLRTRPARLPLAIVCATLATTAAIWSLSFGAWQGWWLAVLGLTAAGLVLAVRDLTPDSRRQPRLLFLATEYYFFEALRKELTEGAMRQGYQIFVAARCGPGDISIRHEGITVIDFDWRRSPSILVSLALFLPDLVRVGRLLSRVRPTVLHNIALKPSVVASLACSGRDIAIINAIHGLGFLFVRRDLLARLAQILCGAVLMLSARLNQALILVINRHDLTLVQERMGISATRTRLIHGTGIDLSRFAALPDPPPPFRFLVIGRLLYMKGTDIVIDAHRLLRERGCDAELVICGSPDPDNPSSIPFEVIAEWGKWPGVTLAGQVSDVRPYLASSHVLVHPSRGGEGLPRALSEAAACARALIATDIAGNTELVIDGVTGRLVPPGDAAALADAMQWMMEHPTERLRYGQAGRAMVARDFSSEQVTKAHAEIYQDIAAGSRAAVSSARPE